MQFRLRTLLILLAVIPPLLAICATFFLPVSRFEIDITTGPWPETNLQLHAYEDDLQGLHYELRTGGSIDTPDAAGRTALHWAVMGNARLTVRALLQNGASPSRRDAHGFLPVDYAQDTTIRALLNAASADG